MGCGPKNAETDFLLKYCMCIRLALVVCLKDISDCMGSHSGSLDTTHTPPPCHFTIPLKTVGAESCINRSIKSLKVSTAN
jgi:hypothetical protein